MLNAENAECIKDIKKTGFMKTVLKNLASITHISP